MQQSDMTAAPNSSEQPVAWVTGSGAARVGQQIARRFAASGYRIVIHAHRSIEKAKDFSDELSKGRIESLIVQGDLADSQFAASSVAKIMDRFGRIDVLVNSAAIWDWKPFEQITHSDVQKQFEVNSLGTFLCSQHAGLAMVKQSSGGSIILIGDWAVSRPYANFAAYFAGKGAIETMTKSLAVELAIRNPKIRVNAVLPGPVMLDPSINHEQAVRIAQDSLLKRLGTPEDVAEAAFFLSQQHFITGACLPVDGGRSIYAGGGTDSIAHPTYIE
ncbi:MAG: SDR family oxidoreductase [Pirellula sp.]|jgi:NAD(P)-dependent dehydrogenase (short-subunit alcohol dehydrogenase family)|nr:SDR family oxidoreductase [Pirellula sp.]